jgi:hypothetical protein
VDETPATSRNSVRNDNPADVSSVKSALALPLSCLCWTTEDELQSCVTETPLLIWGFSRFDRDGVESIEVLGETYSADVGIGAAMGNEDVDKESCIACIAKDVSNRLICDELGSLSRARPC